MYSNIVDLSIRDDAGGEGGWTNGNMTYSTSVAPDQPVIQRSMIMSYYDRNLVSFVVLKPLLTSH